MTRKILVRTLAVVAAVVLAGAGAGSVGAGGAQAAPVGAAGSGCHYDVLPPLVAGGAAWATGGDPSGRYVIGTEPRGEAPWTPRSVLWIDRRPHELAASQAGLADFWLADVNSSGTVVGVRESTESPYPRDAFVYRHGRIAMLPALRPGDDTYAVAVNARGDIVGYSVDPQRSGDPYRGIVWPAGHPNRPRELVVPGREGAGVNSTGMDIDDDGTVMASLYSGGTYVWPPRGDPYPLSVYGVALRHGWVAGVEWDGMTPVTVRLDLRTGRSEQLATGEYSPISVNSRGTIGAAGAMLHRDGRTVPLGFGGLPAVTADTGQAAGSYLTGDRAVVWTGC